MATRRLTHSDGRWFLYPAGDEEEQRVIVLQEGPASCDLETHALLFASQKLAGERVPAGDIFEYDPLALEYVIGLLVGEGYEEESMV